jgi:hypothetical protein
VVGVVLGVVPDADNVIVADADSVLLLRPHPTIPLTVIVFAPEARATGDEMLHAPAWLITCAPFTEIVIILGSVPEKDAETSTGEEVTAELLDGALIVTPADACKPIKTNAKTTLLW